MNPRRLRRSAAAKKGHVQRKTRYVPIPGDWVSYLPKDRPPVEDIFVTHKFSIQCPKCFTYREVSVHQLKRRLKRYGDYKCKRCVCKDVVGAAREQIIETSLKKYGCAYPAGSPQVRKKIEATNLKKYGVKNIFESPEMRDKGRKTTRKRWGGETHWQGEWLHKNGVETRVQLFNKLVDYLEKTKRCCHAPKTLREFHTPSSHTLHGLLHEFGRPDLLQYRYYTSEGENELFQFLTEDLGISPDHIIRNNRKVLDGKEIDLLIQVPTTSPPS